MRILTLPIATLILSSCAYTLDTSFQDIEIKTPGAENAVCYTFIDDVRYRVFPPQKITITKSKENLEIDCLAPGNRRKKVIIEPVYSDHAALNLTTGGVTALWDYASKALYQYPEIVYVDFTHTPVKPMPLPAQNNPDVQRPEDYPLEQFSPGKARLNSDSHAPTEIRIRDRGMPKDAEEGFVGDYETFFGEEENMGGKGNVQTPSGNPLE